MNSQEEPWSFRTFFQYVEDSGLRTYDGLVIQNASDISRESDRIRNRNNWTYLQEKNQKKRRQEESSRIGEDVTVATDGGYTGKHFRLGFMTMPAPQDRLPPPVLGFTVRSQSLHSVGGAEDDSAHGRKQPPPKPRRDPNTKLSSSSETVDGISRREQDAAGTGDTCGGVHTEDSRKCPPPKPKRNPNTQLSASFDESFIRNHKSWTRRDKSLSQSHSPASRDTDEDEPVYIEMMGNVLRGLGGPDGGGEDEQSESVYEEMKFPAPDDFPSDGHFDSDIPPPFPNLLSQRPPLLVFPPAPTQCSPNSDESPLTPLDVTKLPALDNAPYEPPPPQQQHRKDRRREASSGRSSAPPLPSSLYRSPGSAHGSPRSQSACPSPVTVSRAPTPLSLKRPPPYDALVAGGSMPRSSSSSSSSASSSHRAAEGGARMGGPASTHGSMQNVSTRSQTPTSPLDELNFLFSSRQAMKRSTGGRKNRDRAGDCRSLPRHRSRDRDGQSSPVSSRMGRSSVSPTMMLCGGGGGGGGGGGAGAEDWKSSCKLGRSASTSGVPSPQHQLHELQHPALSQVPWLCGDATMMDVIVKKRVLCREIKARQRPDKNLCKQDSMPVLPSWRRKPPPYSAPPTAPGHSGTVFWDTAI